MQISSDDEDFQTLEIDSHLKEYTSTEHLDDFIEVQQSIIRQPKKVVRQQKFVIVIKESDKKNANDINLLENQYYLIEVMKGQQKMIENVYRRFSDFDFLFQILFKKHPGVIFPAFPEKGIFSYIKTKVAYTKDETYLKNRMKMVERFMNKILNSKRVFQQDSKERTKFFSSDFDFDMYKKIEKGKQQNWDITGSWNKLKGLFSFGAGIDNKYHQYEKKLQQQKKTFQNLHNNVRLILNLVKTQTEDNQRFAQKQFKDIKNFEQLKQKLKEQNQKNQVFIQSLQELNIQLFCENEDFGMVLNSLANRQQIRQNDDTKALKQFELNFDASKTAFDEEKKESKKKCEHQYKEILNRIQDQGCFA